MSNTALARVEPQAELATPQDPYGPTDHQSAWNLAKIIVDSKLAPGLETQAQAFVVLATGHELGLSPMQSVRGIHNIKGRPSPSADTLVAICKKSHLCETFHEVATTDTQSTWRTKRRGEEPREYTFTIEDAKRAELTGNPMWKKYPRRMLSARAKSFLARDTYPDLTLGLYSQEEMQDTEDDKPIVHRRPEPPAPRPVVTVVQQETSAPVLPMHQQSIPTSTEDPSETWIRLLNKVESREELESVKERLTAARKSQRFPREQLLAMKAACDAADARLKELEESVGEPASEQEEPGAAG